MDSVDTGFGVVDTAATWGVVVGGGADTVDLVLDASFVETGSLEGIGFLFSAGGGAAAANDALDGTMSGGVTGIEAVVTAGGTGDLTDGFTETGSTAVEGTVAGTVVGTFAGTVAGTGGGTVAGTGAGTVTGTVT